MLVSQLNRTKNLKGKFITCLVLSFVLFLVVYFSEIFIAVIHDIKFNPFSVFNIIYFFGFLFVIVPLSLFSMWMIFPPAIENILKSFGIKIEEPPTQEREIRELIKSIIFRPIFLIGLAFTIIFSSIFVYVPLEMNSTEQLGVSLQLLTAFLVCVETTYRVELWNKQRKDNKEYEKIMENPFEMHFHIPSLDKHQIKYKQQGSEEELIDELTIPANFEDVIFIWIKPQINIKISEQFYGFEGGSNKPELDYFNPFVQKGNYKHKWYVDWHGYYHIVNKKIWFAGGVYFPAFKIKTKKEGIYEFRAIFYVSAHEWKDAKKNIVKTVTKKLRLIVK